MLQESKFYGVNKDLFLQEARYMGSKGLSFIRIDVIWGQ